MRQDKAQVHTSTLEQITQWTTEVQTLKQLAYVPRDDEELTAAQEQESLACKFPTSSDCKKAQAERKQIAHDLGLTKRVDRLEKAIETAQNTLKTLGAAPSDPLKDAANDADFLPINPLKHRPTLIAMACEGLAALGMIFFVALLNSLFQKAFGEKWWELRESPQFKQPQRESPPVIQEIPPVEPLVKKKRGLIYIPGFQEWVRVVTPLPGETGKRYAPGQALSHYQEFCKARGYRFAPHATVLGGLLKNESDLRPKVIVGSMNYYELCLRPQLALIKETA